MRDGAQPGRIAPRRGLPRRWGEAVRRCSLAVALPLPFIWFPEPFGNYVGTADVGSINRPTPAVFVALGGWLLLLVVPAVLILTRW